MTAKREIYARLGVQLRSNRRAFKAERIAPGAMGLYAFMVMDARAELPDVDGFVPEEAVLSAWGRPADERLAQVEALCAVDLVERIDGGFVVVKYVEHNDGSATVEKNREAAKARMAKHRTNGEQTANERVHVPLRSADVPYSCSSSLSESDLGSEIASWWGEACDLVEQNTGATLERGPAWLRYWGHRTKSGKPTSKPDAIYWLTSVDVKEQAKAREEARHREQRDKAFDAARRAERHGPEVRPLPSVTPLLRERDRWEEQAMSKAEYAEAHAKLGAALRSVGTGKQ